jgi:hypothetical protein
MFVDYDIGYRSVVLMGDNINSINIEIRLFHLYINN